MNPYNFSVLLFAFGSFFMGLFVWLKRQDSVGKACLAFNFFAGLWGIGFSIMVSQNVSSDTALFSIRLAHVASSMIPISFLHLVLCSTGAIQKYRNKLIFFYITQILFCFFVFSPWFMPSVSMKVGFKYWSNIGWLYYFYTFTFFFLVVTSFILLHSFIRKAPLVEALQLKGFFIASLAGFVGGSLSFLPNYNIMLPQYGLFLTPIYPFAMAYFMIRHRLFDIEQITQIFEREKLASIGLLAASINHEIKNPLYIAKGLLENSIDNESITLEISKRTLSQLNRISEVIYKLNRFAKPNRELATESADLSLAIHAVLDLVSYEFGLDKIRINNQISEKLPLVQMDQYQLEQVLFNLIVNACHAMPNGGELMISSEERDGKIILHISDTGTGMSTERIRHIFEPFHTTKGEKGTGLGLYITKQMTERAGGKIRVESKEGQGTKFVMEFLKV